MKNDSVNYKLLNYVLVMIAILIGIQVVKMLIPAIIPLLSLINRILLPFLVAAGLAFLLNPIVDFFCKLKIKRQIAILLTFVSIVGGIVYAIFNLIPYLVINTQEILNSMPLIIEKVQLMFTDLQVTYEGIYNFDFNDLIAQNSKLIEIFSSLLTQLVGWISSFSSSFMTVVGMVVLVPVMLYYMLSNFYELRTKLKVYLIKINQLKVYYILKESEEIVKGYIQGTIAVSIILSIIATVLFSVIGLRNAIVFGLIIGFFNIVPYVGQIIGTIPAAIFALTVSPLAPVYVVVGVMVLNFLEGNFIKPYVFAKAVDFHPVVLLTLIIVGGQIFGVMGMLFIIPIAGILRIIVKYSWQSFQDYKIRKLSEY
ncbi:MAG: AI-2E family transporter [Turicibacter sp.]